MLRGFRHTLFLLLQVGVVISGGLALLVEPQAWRAIGICMSGALVASLVCERFARRYLHRTLGRLRRAADEIGRGRSTETLEVHRGDDFHKLVSAINLMATRLGEAGDEEQRLHEELRSRERLAFLGELAATVAHEVNNPLDGIQNCSRILRRSMDNPQRARQMLDLIDSGLVRIDLIVRRLLTLAREHVIRPVDVRLCTVLESAIEAVTSRIEANGIRIVRDFETENDHASVDPQLLEQVFVNLMLNAADSMPDGGQLTLSIRRERDAPAGARTTPGAGDVLCASVADTGSGIAADLLPRIFEPFYTTKTSGKGTGLGLPIAARIVDAHRGRVAVSSEAGKGTTFRVYLPAINEGTPRIVESAEPRLAPVSPRS